MGYIKGNTMNIKEVKNEKLFAEFAVQVPADQIQAQIDKRLQEVGKTAKVPGFRPGKIPLAMLQKRYGDAVRGEALEKTVEETVVKALKEKNIKPALQPKVEVTKFDNDNELEFTIAVEKLPEITPSDFSKITLEKLVTPVEDAQVNEVLDRIAGNYKESKALETQRPAVMGDTVRIDFDGSVDGKKLPGMSANDFDLELGTNMFVDTFEEQLVGLKAGDQKSVAVKFPDDYRHPDLKGQNAVFEVTLKEVRESVNPELNDALAQKAGISTLEELKNVIKTQLESENNAASRAKLKRALLDILDETNKFDVPQGMLDMEFQQIWQYHLQDLKSRKEDTAAAEADEASKADFRKIADRRVRLGLLVSEIGEKNKVSVTPQELQQAIMREAYNYRGQEQKVFEFYQKNPQAVASLRAPLYEEKVVDFILTQVKLNEKQVSKEELMHDPEAEEASAEKPKKAAKKK
jgi:trigger factor